MLLISAHLDIGAREGAWIGVYRCQTISVHSLPVPRSVHGNRLPPAGGVAWAG
jgi:hypothetical protein